MSDLERIAAESSLRWWNGIEWALGYPPRRTLTGRVVRTATTLERFVPVIVKRIGVSGCEIVAVGPFQGDARDAELTALAKLDADEAKRTAESRALAATR